MWVVGVRRIGFGIETEQSVPVWILGFLDSRLRWTRVDLQGKRRMACSTIGAMVTLIILSAMSTFR